MRSLRRFRLLLTVLPGILIVLGLAPVGASSANVSQSYQFNDKISIGSIVSLDQKRSDFVQAANITNGSRLLGVAVAANDSLLAVDATAGTVQVATRGNAKTLVSTLNGDIKVGDMVAVSPFSGVGMKAISGSRVIGLAQSALSSNSEGAGKQQITDKNGAKKQVSVGYVSINIAIGVNTTGFSQDKLSTLQKLGKSITGHTVSTLRVLISLVVAIVALLSLIALIYASIYGGIISIGRNPLAKFAIFRSIGIVLVMVAVTAVIAGSTIFSLLR